MQKAGNDTTYMLLILCVYFLSLYYILIFAANRCMGPSWSCGSCICNYLYMWNQWLSPLKFEFEPRSWGGVLDTTLCDKIGQWLAIGRWFSPGTPVSSTNKTDRHDITEILLTVALNTINQPTDRCSLFVHGATQTRNCTSSYHWYVLFTFTLVVITIL